MRLLVVSSCTKSKALDCRGQLTLADFQAGPHVVAARESALPRLTAESLYTGRQHALLREGIATLRAARPGWALEWRIVSAGYGLIPSSRPLAPYQASFSEMPTAAARAWARDLRLPELLSAALAPRLDLGLLMLGERYLSVCGLDEIQSAGGTLLVLGDRPRPGGQDSPHVRRIELGADAPGRFGAPWSAVRGAVARLILGALARDGDRAMEAIHTAGTALVAALPHLSRDR